MNLRLFSIALLISALPILAHADAALTLNKEDFITAQRISSDGETIVRVKLSKSGKAKFKKLNLNFVGQDIHAEIAGVTSHFKLKEPIRGDGLDMGPYSVEDAQRVISEVNHN